MNTPELDRSQDTSTDDDDVLGGQEQVDEWRTL